MVVNEGITVRDGAIGIRGARGVGSCESVIMLMRPFHVRVLLLIDFWPRCCNLMFIT